MKTYGIFIIMITSLFISCFVFKPEAVDELIVIGQYIPFGENTKTLKLSEQSTLKLENNLPKIDGATALLPLYSAFVQAVYPEKDYSHYKIDGSLVFNRNTTSVAYNNLMNGLVDIIFCAKPSEEQIEIAKEKGISFTMTPIGREAFVFFVNKINSVSNLTTEQIEKIYTGQIVSWSELGGNNNPIRAYQRNKNSGSQTMLLSIIKDGEIIQPLTEEVLNFMGDMFTKVSAYRNYKDALGYSFLYYTTQMVRNNDIKLLSINDIFPSKETIQDNTYPYSDVFYAIYTNTENENINGFVDWILSEQGQNIVELVGYVPIK